MKFFLILLMKAVATVGAVLLSLFLVNMGLAAMTMPDDLSLVGGCMTIVTVAAAWVAFVVRTFHVWKEKFTDA